ncbi:type VI secretion system baseplate subunit TssK [Pseudoduganella sp. LjRoot289]|uniref:type VI secretion system baseplate subunit TssK n=1 Tax=Pseudoduganella sp. LjRoot289 TaxID=3342314 RepID=UPI003ECF75BC
MNMPLKVLWSEGLTLEPHQLQQLDRYHEARLQRTAAAMQPNLWGIQSVEWNRDALRNNLLQANGMSLMFPDGEIYDAPGGEVLPPPVDLSRLAADTQLFTFFACMPSLEAHGGNLSTSGLASARYGRIDREVQDLFSGAVDANVAYLCKTVRLLSHLEPRDAFVSFPAIRLRRLATGGFEEDHDYLPPGVSIGSPYLKRMLDSLLAKMQAKIAALQLRHRQSAKDVLEFHSGDIASYWMLSTLSTAGAGLSHAANYGQHHPEHLFERLAALAGGLMTFSTKYTLSDLPSYRHADAAPGFAKLDGIIRELADTVLSSRYFTIPLAVDPKMSANRIARLDPAHVDKTTMLGLAVRADMPPLELVAKVPVRFKLGCPADVDGFIRNALPGLPLVHMAQVPQDVPVRPNTYYFSIERLAPLYEAMLAAQMLTVFSPSGMDGLEIELFALKGL